MPDLLKPLPYQPPIWVSYIKSGKLLYASMFLFILESWIYGYFMVRSFQNNSLFWKAFWVSFFLFSFVHIFLVLADGWSRFQNYKRVKDQLFMYGFQPRIMIAYMGSKCQRLAAIAAAEELGWEDETQKFFYDQGYRWYHWVPDFMMKDPMFMIRNYFWQRTFLEKSYTSKFDYQRLYRQLQLT
jgi:hypothetical protein